MIKGSKVKIMFNSPYDGILNLGVVTRIDPLPLANNRGRIEVEVTYLDDNDKGILSFKDEELQEID